MHSKLAACESSSQSEHCSTSSLRAIVRTVSSATASTERASVTASANSSQAFAF
jgi:hypothetical protein